MWIANNRFAGDPRLRARLTRECGETIISSSVHSLAIGIYHAQLCSRQLEVYYKYKFKIIIISLHPTSTLVRTLHSNVNYCKAYKWV